MKKTTLIVLTCLLPTLTWAHDMVVPHAHGSEVHGWLPFLMYATLIVGAMVGIKYLHKKMTASNS